ncbi:hypothetical protein PV327_011261, partial [Microctonus hyperodae]
MASQSNQQVYTSNSNQGHPGLPPSQIYNQNIENMSSMTDTINQYNNNYSYDVTPSTSMVSQVNHEHQTPENIRQFHNLQTRKRVENENDVAVIREESGKILQELGYLRKMMENMAVTINAMERKQNAMEGNLNAQRTEDANNIFEPPQGFPMKTIEEFENFESGDEYIHESLKSHLIFIGGQTLREALNSYFR